MDSATTQGAHELPQRITAGFEKLALALKTSVWHGASSAGLSATQAQIVALVAARGSRTGLRLADIAEELAITPATASDALRALVAKELIVKGRATGDARALAVRTTEKGSAVAARMSGLSTFLATAVGELSPAEQEALQLALVRLISRLQDEGRIPFARMCANCVYLRTHVHADDERPHHCALADTAIGARDFRFDCPEHVRADAPRIAAQRVALGIAIG
ncbi:MAG: MarR family winged helix-turn-helix transcriptional regulator [Planctomycetes bacterium]|nr:MarR family winged helix-turn-helix transcriptional regulator [Planctomycetota bacterium]